MEDYRVTQTGDEIQEILNQSPIDTADIVELKEAATSLDGRLESVEGKIPAGASEENPLADKQYVDDSIASASATFRGTYNEVTDLELTTEATHADIGSALDEVIELADSNDYCFVQIPTADATPTEIESIERYKFVTGTGWQYEYTLNNSGFTADQWAAINSCITSGLVAKLTGLPTNAELENLLNGKANATDVYTKSETYNKTELDSMITTPDVQYVSVTATAQTTAVTDVLPSTGAADTVYRVGSWDGTQYNANSYSEYAWNGSSYVLLNVKETGIATGSDFDNPTPAQRELVTTVGSVLDGISEGVFDLTAKTGDSYATLADALTAANTAIPTNKKRGGMSIKFVQSSDNKYVQYFLAKKEWSASETDWQKMNLEEEVSQLGQKVTELESDVADLNDTVFTENETTQPVVPSTYYQGIIRHSTLKVGASSNPDSKLYYFPVVAGRKYNLSGTNIYISSSEWDLIGFSIEIPTSGVSYESILSPTSAGNNTYNEEFIPSQNGYLLVYTQYAGSISDRLSITETSTSKSSNIGDLSELVTTAKDNLVNAINEIAQNEHSEDIGDLANLKTTAKANIVASINELHGASSLVASETQNRVTLSDYVSPLIMRNTTLKFEGSSSESYRVIYVPVVAGSRYSIKGTNVSISSTSWSWIGFSTTIPSRGGSYIDILSPSAIGTQAYEKDYVAVSDGYLCIFYSNDLAVLDSRLQVYEYISRQEYAIPLVLGGKVSSIEDAKTAFENGELSFNIGLTNLRSVTEHPDTLTIDESGSNYNDCIKQYINTQDGRKTSKFIPTGVVNLDPHIGDFSTLGTTYWREVIGVDSEGWIYCAQRKYGNLSGEADVNIYKTKDFENFEVFKANSCGHQLIELENGELCLATYETETVDGASYIRCFIYVTSGHKTVFNKKFYCTQIGQYNPASPWSWGIQSRGKVVAVGEYGQHGQCGKVWYSRDYGENFYEVFDLRDKAPDVPHAHVHGICIDPYFDRLYIINGDGSPATSSELLHKNPRLWYWDYGGEALSNNLKDTIDWQYVNVGEDVSLGSNLQFVCGYALKDCILLSSDGSNNGIFRINRGRKEDVPTVDFAHHLGIETNYTKFCGGNMFRKDENSPLFVCVIREYSCDLDPGDSENPSNKPNTYKDVLSRVYSTYDGFHFEEVWIDDTYGTYIAHYSGGTSEQRNLAKCGRDMCVWQLPSGEIILKYLGRDFTYVAYNNNGVTAVTKTAYVDFANYVAKFIIK